MCNRYRVTAKQIEIAQRYGVDPALLFPEPETLPPPELFPKRSGWVVVKTEPPEPARSESAPSVALRAPAGAAPSLRTSGACARRLAVMRWGIPLPPTGKPVTNVRNLASPFWRSMLKNPARRCLVPVTDFCEWSGEKGAKQEHWFSIREQPIFSFAGIWRPTPEGNAYAFLTCEPNPLVEPIHAKAMPVILHDEDYDRWLDGEVDEVCSLATPFPSQLMAVG
jgi:putative SOS response-associated peptidase YedK